MPKQERRIPQVIIPEWELSIEFVRSGGAGGQKVNKTSSKAQLRWHPESSAVLSDKQKHLIRKELGSRLTRNGEIVLSCDEERSQIQNKERCIARLHDMVNEAIIPVEERTATKPTRSSQLRRMDTKTIVGRKKVERRKNWKHDE